MSKSIHSIENIAYVREELGASAWVIKTLTEGYSVPFSRLPGKYKEENNRSAIKHAGMLWEKMLEWEKKGFCVRVKTEPFCCNPMTVAEKKNLRTGKIKLRPCMDFSRHVNKFIEDQPVRLANLEEAEKLLEEADYQTSFDMENMYFQIEVKKMFQKYFGCAIMSPEGEQIYFQFKVLVYGLKSAVYAVTKLTRPLVKKANLLGIRMSIYIDDGKVLGRSKTECEANLKTVLSLMETAGWKINYEKTITNATQAIYYLGLITCTNPLLYYLPDFKIDHIIRLLEKGITNEKIEKRDFARLLGSVIAGHKALGPVARILLRSSHVMLATETENFLNMKGKLELPFQIKQELAMLRDIIKELNGQQIITSRTGVTFSQLWNENKADERLPFMVKGEAQEPKVQGVFRGNLPNEMLYDIVASDASDFQEHAFSVLRIEDVHTRELAETEREYSSGLRELGAMLNYLRNKANVIFSRSPKLIYWLTDSQNVCNWLQRGSRKQHIQSELIT